MDFYFVITKKEIKRASADVGLMFIAYNLRRLMNIIDPTVFKKFLENLELLFNEIPALVKVISFEISPFNIFDTGYQSISRPLRIASKLNYI